MPRIAQETATAQRELEIEPYPSTGCTEDDEPVPSSRPDYLIFAVDEDRWLAFANDQAGTCWWKTPQGTGRDAKVVACASVEAARAEAAAERAAKEEERAAKEAALARIAELEALLAKQKG